MELTHVQLRRQPGSSTHRHRVPDLPGTHRPDFPRRTCGCSLRRGRCRAAGNCVHQWDNLHTFALLQQARRQIDIPIVATGGIVDGHGMAAAFALGAEGVWMGTRFISALGCPWHHNYKQAIVDAEHVIGIDMKLPVIPAMRAVRNPFAEAVAKCEAGHRRNPYAGEAMKLFYEGRTDLALVGCGESAVLIDAVKPAAQIIQDTVQEFWDEIERLSSLLRPRVSLEASG
jgi:enoyl-[acyl-carrier protein] reductase II